MESSERAAGAAALQPPRPGDRLDAGAGDLPASREPMAGTGTRDGVGVPMTPPATPAATRYRPDIDGLRAVAVLSVVVYHAFPQLLGGGFVGVDIFFVISGYLISTIIFSQLEKGRFSFAEFYARRIRRIFPALLAVLATCLALGWFGMLTDEFRELGKHVAAGMGFVSNLVLWSESGYFDADAHSKPLLHLWSLGIEEQFYIFWPLLAWAAWKRRKGLLWLTVVAIVASFALNLYGIGRDPVATFYSPLSRAWELSVGSLLAFLVLARRHAPETSGGLRADAISVAGVALLVLAVLVIDSGRPFPGWWATIPVIGSALVIAAGSQAWLNRYVLANPVAVWIGLISYPLYLWHWPALYIAREVEGAAPDAAIRGIAIGASFLLAWMTYWFIERHVRHRKGRGTVAALVAAGLLVTAAGIAVYVGQGVPSRAVVATSGLTEKVNAQFTGAHWQYTQNDICMKRYPYPGWEQMTVWFCIQNRQAPPTLMIIGSSHANQLYPGFASNPALAHHTVLSIGACAIGRPMEDYSIPPKEPCYGTRSREQRDFIRGIIAREPSIRFVVLAGFADTRRNRDYSERIRDWVVFLEKQGIKVILFKPHMKIAFHPRECFRGADAIGAADCSFPASARAELDEAFRPVVNRISKKHPGAGFFDQNGIYCRGARCSFVHDGMPLHRDASGHISEYASILLQDDFTAWARANMPELLDPAYLETSERRLPNTVEATRGR